MGCNPASSGWGAIGGLLFFLAGIRPLTLAVPFSLVYIEHIAILIFDQG